MGKIFFTRYREKMCALLLDDNRLLAMRAMSDSDNRIGAIYVGKIKNVVKNIHACFVEIADGELCFLSMNDATAPIILNRKYDGRLLAGDEIMVQLSKEAQKTKQPSVTADISLSNEYAAISIGSTRIGFSGKLDKTRKDEIHAWLTDSGYTQEKDFVSGIRLSDIPLSLGLVVRTRAKEGSKEDILHPIETLINEFQLLLDKALHRTCFSCIKEAPEDYETVLDCLAYPYEYNEIVTDDNILYSKLDVYCKEKLPQIPVRLYEDANLSLSKLYSLEQKFDTAFKPRVWLKSGGYLVIEHTEALTVIDVNTGKYEAKNASDNTYEKINREAAEEIALQMRLRNLSGIILVDFINMDSKEKEESLIQYLRDLVRKDKIKTLVIDITPLGLVEITRKKQHKPLREQFLAGTV